MKDVIQEKVKGYGIEYVKKEKLSVEEYADCYMECTYKASGNE